MTEGIKKQIKRRKELYADEGGVRTAAWKEEKRITKDMIRKSKRGYMDVQKDHILAEDANRNFFKHVKNFSRLEKPHQFDVRDLESFKGKSDEEVAEDLAAFFNRVSMEFNPLRQEDIPRTHTAPLPRLHKHEVSARIRRFRKPKSMVPGDVFPQLVTTFADFFAIPLTAIYNDISESGVWPTCWKREYVTVIPKTKKPSSVNDLRNISCTLLASKMYESYVLDWLKEEVKLRSNQYGGVRGVGTQHLLVRLMQEILENAEDYRAATVVTSIDYSKAFNRMSFQYCLEALAKNGASSGVLKLVAAFLTDRTMRVKVGEIMSRPREVHGGCPQGSILGVFLFNATIDDLEEGCEDLVQVRPPNNARVDWEIPESTPVPSTPIRREAVTLQAPEESPIIKRPVRRSRRLDYSSEARVDLPPEKNDRTESKWHQTLALLLRYIDDGFSLSKINFENSYGFTVTGIFHRVKHAVQCQNVFRHLVRRAEDIGMVVNAKKTTMVCVSDSLSFQADAFIYDADQDRIGCQSSFKALGMWFSNRPNVEAQVEAVKRGVRSRLWTLRNLKNSGFTTEELVRVYTTMIRPVADYAAVAYHSLLTDEQDEAIDNLQNAALKMIFGPGPSARKLRSMAGLTTLRARREELCDKFASKCVGNPLFADWFPLKNTRMSTRGANREIYLETTARCERLRNSPLHYFRRRLNGKPGKIYGKRYEEYREDRRED